MVDIDITHLKSVLNYNPETGIWISLVKDRKRAAGVRADRKHWMGYYRVSYLGKRYLAHRLAFFFVTGRWPIGIDHKDRDKRNNKWSNLREANQHENGGNTKLCSRNTSGHRGVFWNKCAKKWEAQIKIRGRSTVIGRFESKEAASKAYTERAIEHFGSYYNAP